MRAEILGLLAETPLHPGVGQEEGAVDLPFAREEPFGIPVVPGSGLKGALREKRWGRAYDAARGAGQDDEGARETADDRAGEDFGTTEEAGPLALSDARLLLLPVRAIDRLYRWVTCPYVLERWSRDLARVGSGLQPPKAAKTPPAEGEVLLAGGAGRVFLEGLDFEVQADEEGVIASIAASLGGLIGHPAVAARLADQLALVHDTMFEHFARHALPVAAHNVLDRRKVSQNLFYEETLPADSLLYAVAAERTRGALDRLDGLFGDDPYLRLGGNETLGQGWCRVVRVG
jgi:CRISPR-associated protein Cmr4